MSSSEVENHQLDQPSLDLQDVNLILPTQDIEISPKRVLEQH